MKTIFLSYLLENNLSCYNGNFNIETSLYKNNELNLNLKGHCGTHIDFPFHINSRGKRLDDYCAEDFIFNNVFVKYVKTNELYITSQDLNNVPNDIDMLVIKTNLCHKRNDKEYTSANIGISLDATKFLRNNFPNLKCIGIDSISLNAYQDKEQGKLAHKDLLGNAPEILVIEDMDLRELNSEQLSQVIVAPLRVKNADGVSVTVFAKVKES